MDVKTNKSTKIVIRYKNDWSCQKQDLILFCLRKTPSSVLLDKLEILKTEVKQNRKSKSSDHSHSSAKLRRKKKKERKKPNQNTTVTTK